MSIGRPAHRSTYRFGDDRADADLLERELRQAVIDEAFDLRYRPMIDRRTGLLVAVDSLIEWHHRSLGPIRPDVFLPLAESTSLIIPIGEWMLWQAVLTTKSWHEQHGLEIVVSIGISTQQLTTPTFLATLADVIETSEIEPRLVMFVLSGSVDLDDCERVASTFEALRLYGIGVAFGTMVREHHNFDQIAPMTAGDLAATYGTATR